MYTPNLVCTHSTNVVSTVYDQNDPMSPNHRFGVLSKSNSNSPPGGRNDVWRATEALAAIPGRFDRLLTCDELARTRSTRGSAVSLEICYVKDVIFTL